MRGIVRAERLGDAVAAPRLLLAMRTMRGSRSTEARSEMRMTAVDTAAPASTRIMLLLLMNLFYI